LAKSGRPYSARGGGGPPRVTPSRGDDTVMKVKIFAAEFTKCSGQTISWKAKAERGTMTKKAHHFFEEKI